MITLFPSRIVAIEIFGFSVHWYGLLYLIGFVLMTIVLPRLQHYRELSLQKDEWNDLFFWIVLILDCINRRGLIASVAVWRVGLYSSGAIRASPVGARIWLWH